ncbi:MAG TPA: YqzL family protein [Candidatus Limihabitans stercoravium]|nr:YqzL family protein [Candidatus Limihabitans stercoravium]
MKDTAWKMFQLTGNPSYYLLYKRLDDGHKHKSSSAEKH